MMEAALDPHAVIIRVAPLAGDGERLGNGDGRTRAARLDLGDQSFLPLEPLELPNAKADQHGKGGERKRGEPEEPFGPHRAMPLFGGELALFGLVPELKGDQHALEGPKQDEWQEDGERTPEQGVQPIGWSIEDLDDEGEADDDEAGHQDDEDGGSIPCLGEAVVEAADVAARSKGEIAIEQLAAVAGRAASRHPRPQRGPE